MGSVVSGLKSSYSGLAKGNFSARNIAGVATLGLSEYGQEEAGPGPQSFSDRMKELEAAGTFGGKSMAGYQAQNQARIDTGFGYSNQAAQEAQKILLGQEPSMAQLQLYHCFTSTL